MSNIAELYNRIKEFSSKYKINFISPSSKKDSIDESQLVLFEDKQPIGNKETHLVVRRSKHRIPQEDKYIISKFRNNTPVSDDQN